MFTNNSHAYNNAFGNIINTTLMSANNFNNTTSSTTSNLASSNLVVNNIDDADDGVGQEAVNPGTSESSNRSGIEHTRDHDTQQSRLFDNREKNKKTYNSFNN